MADVFFDTAVGSSCGAAALLSSFRTGEEGMYARLSYFLRDGMSGSVIRERKQPYFFMC